MPPASRRSFLRAVTATTLGSLGLTSSPAFSQPAPEPEHGSLPDLEEGAVIVFQGDSITDGGRDKNNTAPNSQRGLGPGYAFLAASHLLETYPEKNLQCYNRGISGNKVFQLADRWQEDCIALEPDILSVLIGVNDFWHAVNGSYDGTVEVYERDLRQLLDRTLEALPDTQLIIGEPYALPQGSAVSNEWFPTFNRYRDTSRRIAADYNAAFIPYQSIYEEASQSVPQTYWSPDGVHPSTAGCQLMAEAWLETFRSMDL